MMLHEVSGRSSYQHEVSHSTPRDRGRRAGRGMKLIVRLLLCASTVGAASDFPVDVAKAACYVYANAKSSNQQWYRLGCDYYVSEGGTLSACKAKCGVR